MTGWIVSRLDKNKVEAVNEAGNARFVFIKSGRAWDGACVSLEELVLEKAPPTGGALFSPDPPKLKLRRPCAILVIN